MYIESEKGCELVRSVRFAEEKPEVEDFPKPKVNISV